MFHTTRYAKAGQALLVGLYLVVPSTLVADQDAPASGSTVLAVVNGEEVLTESVEKTLSRSHQTASASGAGTMDLDRLVFKVVNDVLLAQEARAMGMAEEEAIATKVQDYRQDLAKRRLEYEEVQSLALPTDKEVRLYFDRRYRKVTFRVITAYDQEGANRLFQQIQDGADFGDLAQQESVDPYRLRGGMVKDIEHIDLQAGIGELVFALEPGQIGGPVQTDLGWSIVQVESFEAPSEERLLEVEDKVRSILRLEKARVAKHRLAEQLRDKYEVVKQLGVIDAIQPTPQPDGRLLPAIEDAEATVVTVDGEPAISAAGYGHALLSRWKGVRNIEAAKASAPIVLAALIDDELVRLEALQRGYDQTPESIRAVHAFESDLLVTQYLKEVVAANVEVRSEDMQTYYKEHKEELHRPPKVRLGQITVASEEEAARIADNLRGGADLGWLAKQHSIDGFKELGGDRGWYEPRPDIPDFNADLFEAKVGAVLEPFGMPGNWVVLKVTAREEQGIYDYDQVSGNIRDRVFAEKFRQELDVLITTLRSRSEIEIDQKSLAQLQIMGSQAKDSPRGDGFGHGQ